MQEHDFSLIILSAFELWQLKIYRSFGPCRPIFKVANVGLRGMGLIVEDSTPGKYHDTDLGRRYLVYYRREFRRYDLPVFLSIISLVISIVALLVASCP